MTRGLKEGVVFALLMLVIATALDWWRQPEALKSQVFTPTLYDLQGQTVDLVEMSLDKPVLVYVWATWCGVCRVTTPIVEWVSGDHTVLSIALTSGNNDRVQRYMTVHDITFRTVNDERNQLERDWQIRYTPTFMIVRNGQIQSVTSGFTTPWGLLARLWLA